MRMGLSLFLFLSIWSFGAVAYHVEDEAHLFSPRATAAAEREIEQILHGTEPQKEILIKTVPRLPSGSSPVAESESLFRARRLGGVLIYLVKNPHRLVVTVGKQTELRFRGKDDVRQAMLGKFKQNDYDAGLAAGLNVLRNDLLTDFPAGARSKAAGPYSFQDAAQPVAASQSRGGGLGLILLIGAGVLLVLFIRAVLRQRRNENSQYPINRDSGLPPSAGGYGGYGPGPSGGGGFGRGLLGGILGGLGASWLYDRFAGPRHPDNGYGGGSGENHPVSGDGGGSGFLPNDDGEVGSSSNASWDSADTTSFDSGGGGDFDLGGGGDSSGGDW